MAHPYRLHHPGRLSFGDREELLQATAVGEPRGNTLRVERLSGAEALERLAPEWEALDARVSPRTPFTSPLWNMLWGKHFRSDRLVVRDELLPYIGRDAASTRTATWAECHTSRPRNLTESLRKCYNSLKRGGVSFVFRVVELPDETAAALDIFFELHAQRARAVGTVEHRDVFAAPRARAFLSEYARRMADRGQLRSS